jgi:hypothetical protein
MYGSLRNTTMQTQAVLATAKSVLEPEEHDVLVAISALCTRALKPRNHLAHWVWGQSRGYPEAIILIDPKPLLEYETGIGRFAFPNEGRGLLASFDSRTCLVFDRLALDEALAGLREAEELLARFRFGITPGMREISEPSLAGLPELRRHPALAKTIAGITRAGRQR